MKIAVSSDSESPLIQVEGEIDLSNAHVLREAIEQASDSHPDRLVIDMSAVTFMDSTGLNVLCRAGTRVNILVRSPSPRVRRLLNITGTTDGVAIAQESGDQVSPARH
jgi:stage II sporulation protein AA (anti-sigma F factor antagonist)